MSFVPQFDKLNLYEEKQCESKQIKVECKSEIETENISKVLCVSANSYVEQEKSNENIKYVGKTIFYICYLDKDGELQKCECGSEFIGEIEGEAVGEVFLTAKTVKTESDISNVKLLLRANINVSVKYNVLSEYEVLNGGEGIVSKDCEVESIKKYGKKCGTYTVENEFDLSYPVKEVLYQNGEANVSSVQCGVGSIIVDGEVYLSAIVLQNNEKSDIIKENKIIPFRMEVGYEDAMPSFGCSSSVVFKGFKTDISVDEEGRNSNVNVVVSLCYEVEAYSTENIKLSEDVFSVYENVKLEYEKVAISKPCACQNQTAKVFLRAPIEKIQTTERLVAIFNEKAQVVSLKPEGDKLEIVGAFYFESLFVDENKNYRVINSETPFTVKCEMVANCDKINANVLCYNSDGRIISNEELEVSTELKINICCEELKQISYIKSIEGCGEKPKNDSAISVYIPQEGEDLWTLSKRLNTCPEMLVETNKELQFPLSGKERIVIFRKK